MIGASKRGSQLTLSMGEKLLSLHMKDKNKAKAIAEKLNKSYYSHGYPVGKAEAKEIGLQIESNDNEDLDKLIQEDFETKWNVISHFHQLISY